MFRGHQHINALNGRLAFLAALVGAVLSPEERSLRDTEMRRVTRQLKRSRRSASYPYCGKRQSERYGRQVEQGRLKAENGLVI